MFVEQLNKLKQENTKYDPTIMLYHGFMKYYSTYIPFEEFLKIPLPLAMDLAEMIQEEAQRIEEQTKKFKK
jgi:hypothetical protein